MQTTKLPRSEDLFLDVDTPIDPNYDPETAEFPEFYLDALTQAKLIDVSSIHPVAPIAEVGHDREGNRTILITPYCQSPGTPETVQQLYSLTMMNPILFSHFTQIIPCIDTIYPGSPQTSMPKRKEQPKMDMKKPFVGRDNMQHMILVNPPTFAKVAMGVMKTIMPSNVMKKIKLVKTLEDLYEYISPEELQLPCLFYRLEFNSVLDCVHPQAVTGKKKEKSFEQTSPFHPTRLFPILPADYIPLTLLNIVARLVRGLTEESSQTPSTTTVETVPIRQTTAFNEQPNQNSLDITLKYLVKDPLQVLAEDLSPSVLLSLLTTFLKQIPGKLFPSEWVTRLIVISKDCGQIDTKESKDALIKSLSTHILTLPISHLGTFQLLFQLFTLVVSPYTDGQHPDPAFLFNFFGPSLLSEEYSSSSDLQVAFVFLVDNFNEIWSYCRQNADKSRFPAELPLYLIPVVYEMIQERIRTAEYYAVQARVSPATNSQTKTSEFTNGITAGQPHIYCFSQQEVEKFLAVEGGVDPRKEEESTGA
ncbi:hypothetical protein BLNAU_14686 [Blattamonas nauphoetae]|uniref:Rho-GAP domain-containing protein n=1 Tax=Blattamonas nauphoetae TaxID=2049346 RepID=A0ABQ9XJB3_9EUKA|nr:hypothetical protein BLNAU_14686 [Blattamonas nauphoetae]